MTDDEHELVSRMMHLSERSTSVRIHLRRWILFCHSVVLLLCVIYLTMGCFLSFVSSSAGFVRSVVSANAIGADPAPNMMRDFAVLLMWDLNRSKVRMGRRIRWFPLLVLFIMMLSG